MDDVKQVYDPGLRLMDRVLYQNQTWLVNAKYEGGIGLVILNVEREIIEKTHVSNEVRRQIRAKLGRK
jgi:hypothetical protein